MTTRKIAAVPKPSSKPKFEIAKAVTPSVPTQPKYQEGALEFWANMSDLVVCQAKRAAEKKQINDRGAEIEYAGPFDSYLGAKDIIKKKLRDELKAVRTKLNIVRKHRMKDCEDVTSSSVPSH